MTEHPVITRLRKPRSVLIKAKTYTVSDQNKIKDARNIECPAVAISVIPLL